MQTLTVDATGGTYKLSFQGQSTGATGSGDTDSSSKNVTGVTADTGSFVVGEHISGTNIPADAVISFVTNASKFTFSSASNATATGHVTNLVADLPYDAGFEAVRGALLALPAVPSGGLQVSGSGSAADPFVIDFHGGLGGTDLPQIAVDDAGLTGIVTAATTTEGSGEYEICTVAAKCRSAALDGSSLAGNVPNVSDADKNGALTSPQGIAVDEDTGNVYVSDRDGRRINEYTGTGAFIRSFGFGVDTDVAGNGYEVCPAAHRCQAGIAGPGAGQIGSASSLGSTLGLAVSGPDGNPSTGTLFLADSANQRVNTYNLDGTSPGSFGSSADFGTGQPSQVAVDAAGVVYASNSKAAARSSAMTAPARPSSTRSPRPPRRQRGQKVNFGGFQTGDTFTLGGLPGSCSASTTDAIAYSDVAATLRASMQAALEAKCGAGNFSVTGNNILITITFQGAFALTDEPTISCAKVSDIGRLLGQPIDRRRPSSQRPAARRRCDQLRPRHRRPCGHSAGALYVLRTPASGNTVVQEFDSPGGVTPPAAADDAHGGEAGLDAVYGLGLDDSSGRLFVSSTATSQAPARGPCLRPRRQRRPAGDA